MEFDIQGNPTYGQLRVRLNPGEKFIAEGGSMAWMDTAMQSKTRLLGGFFRALLRKVTGGESMFVGEYFSGRGGEAAFSPSRPGTVLQRTLRGDSIILTGGSVLACTPGIELSTQVVFVHYSPVRAYSSSNATATASCSSIPTGRSSRRRSTARSSSIRAMSLPGSRV